MVLAARLSCSLYSSPGKFNKCDGISDVVSGAHDDPIVTRLQTENFGTRAFARTMIVSVLIFGTFAFMAWWNGTEIPNCKRSKFNRIVRVSLP
jgi:predicted secreted protein